MAQGGADKDRTELRKEIGIALYWRGLLGDLEYVKFDPDDMLRWYLAMELRGYDDVLELLEQRFSNSARRMPVLGLVGEAPHPPVWLVREWLASMRPKLPTGRIFAMTAAFFVTAFLVFPAMHGCADLQTSNPLAYTPPQSQPNMMQANANVHVGLVPSGQVPSVASVVTAVPKYSSSATGGSVAPSVNTSPVNGGISAGVAPP